jgi:tetratricopeptide (TPR) repeat protein
MAATKPHPNFAQQSQSYQQAFSAHQAGDLPKAEMLYRQVLKKQPGDMETLYLLGTACSQQAKFLDAEKFLSKAVRLAPRHPEALNNLGLTMKALRKYDDAIALYHRALAVNPNYADALNNLGNVLEIRQDFTQAEGHLRKALMLAPDMANAHHNLGLVLKNKDQFEEAVRCFLRGIELSPANSIVYDDLGQIYKIWGRLDDALDCFNRALALAPDSPSAHNNRGATLEEMGRFDEALIDYEISARLQPDDILPVWNQAFFHLRNGVLQRGWELFEMRFQVGLAVERFHFPRWEGDTLTGKTLLIYAEQGVGDEILFASCFNDVIAQAGHCVIECEARLKPLFERSFPAASFHGTSKDETAVLINASDIDVQTAAGSLPRFVRKSLDAFPKQAAYLQADLQRIAYWQSEVNRLGNGLKVGICWRSGLQSGERHRLYSLLSEWGPILRTAGVEFINLQYGECSAELAEAEQLFGVKIHHFSEINLRDDLDDSAALTSTLDLVISAATAVAEMAGALGIEVWRIDDYLKPWTALGTNAMPWHPSMQLFGQTTRDDWSTPLALIAASLKDKLSNAVHSCSYVAIDSGIDIAVMPTLENFESYQVREQGGVIESECQYITDMTQPPLRSISRILDIDPGVGTYAVPLAVHLSHGQLLAFTTSAEHTRLLTLSRDRHRLSRVMTIAIADLNCGLDLHIDSFGLNTIDFVRMSATWATDQFFSSSTQFFAQNSPLLMIHAAADLGPGNSLSIRSGMLKGLRKLGYAFYRFVPGLMLLASFQESEDDLLQDGDTDNLNGNVFACKSDRATLLAQQGKLVQVALPIQHYPGIDQTYWQQLIGSKPYAASLIDGWTQPNDRPESWEVYWMALNLFAQSQLSALSAAQRYASLQTSASILSTLATDAKTIPRLLSLCRVLIDLGERETAMLVLEELCSMMDQGSDLIHEPFLALEACYEAFEPGARMQDWMIAMLLTQREKLCGVSTYHTGLESLPLLDAIRDSGFSNDLIQRKIDLITLRFAAPI